MRKSQKIALIVIALICAVIGFTCLVGFAIGGRFGLLQLILFLLIGTVLSLLSIMLINGKDFVKSKKFVEPFIILAAGLLFVFYFMYGTINNLSADYKSITYDTTIEYVEVATGGIYADIGFCDQNGNVQNFRDYSLYWYDSSVTIEGASITVEERQGGFGYPIFKITQVNN